MATHTVSPGQKISDVVGQARSGDTVVVKDGTYKGKVNISGSNITVRAENRHKAIIDGSGAPKGQDLIVISGSGITFDGFDVKGGGKKDIGKGGIVLWDAGSCKVTNNKSHDHSSAGIYVGGSVGKANNNLVEGNEVYHNVLENEARGTSGGWARGIGIDHSDNTTVRGNIVYNNYGEGIGIMCCIKAQVLDNVSYDNFSVLIYLDNAQEAKVQENVAWAENGDYFRNNKPALGVSICNEETDRMLPSTGINVTNNTLGGVGKPAYSEYGANTGLKNSTIEPNNICSVEEAKEEAGSGGTDPTPPNPEPEPDEDKVVIVDIEVPDGVTVKVNVNE